MIKNYNTEETKKILFCLAFTRTEIEPIDVFMRGDGVYNITEIKAPYELAFILKKDRLNSQLIGDSRTIKQLEESAEEYGRIFEKELKELTLKKNPFNTNPKWLQN